MTATVVIGLGLAAVGWAWLFAPADRSRFWGRALLAGVAIGAYAVVAQRGRLGDLFDLSIADVAIGVAGAIVLYGVFWAGDGLLRAVVPKVAAEVGDLYRLRGVNGEVAMVCTLLIVGSCEELFWRGLVQQRAGFAVAAAGYTLILGWERKWALILAAATGGAFWGALFAWRGTLVAPIVCHALWDLAVVVWFPFRGRDEAFEAP